MSNQNQNILTGTVEETNRTRERGGDVGEGEGIRSASVPNSLPTTPGPYWFREKGFDKWEPYYVTTLDGKGMVCHRSDYNAISRCLVSEMPSGQWSPISNPDEGIKAFAVFKGDEVIHCTLSAVEDNAKYEAKDFNRCFGSNTFTCQPVTIFKREVVG